MPCSSLLPSTDQLFWWTKFRLDGVVIDPPDDALFDRIDSGDENDGAGSTSPRTQLDRVDGDGAEFNRFNGARDVGGVMLPLSE